MAKKKTEKEPFPPVPCTNCGGPVQQRRPSKTGWHFCSAQACVNAKQKMYRDARVEAKTSEAMVSTATATAVLLGDLVKPDPFKTCSGCGAERVLKGWAHRANGSPDQPCFAAGSLGQDLGANRAIFLDTIMPHLTPAAQKLAAWEADQAAAATSDGAPF